MGKVGDFFNGVGDFLGNPLAGISQFVGAIGGLSAEKKNYELQKDMNLWQKGQWEETKQREDTAMQRRMADLKAAGMNPLLAAGGSGATAQSAPNIAVPQRDPGQIQRSISALAPVQLMQDIARTKAETRRIKAEAALTEAKAMNEPLVGENLKQQNVLMKMEERVEDLGYRITERDFKIVQGKESGIRYDIKAGRWLDRYNVGVGTFTNIVNSGKKDAAQDFNVLNPISPQRESEMNLEAAMAFSLELAKDNGINIDDVDMNQLESVLIDDMGKQMKELGITRYEEAKGETMVDVWKNAITTGWNWLKGVFHKK